MQLSFEVLDFSKQNKNPTLEQMITTNKTDTQFNQQYSVTENNDFVEVLDTITAPQS